MVKKRSHSNTPSGRRIAVTYLPIVELKLDPKNPRLHNKKQIRQIARSIEAFGFNVPVLVNSRSEVIAGHGRILAAKELELDQVPTITLEHLSDAQARAFMIADNRLTEIATWDERLLAEQLKELSLAELDFDIEATGFEMGEIDFRIQGLDGATVTGADPADELPADSGPAVTRPGALWLLGQHRMYCGNALEEASYATLMAGKRAAMAFSDPPYNLRIQGNVSGLGRVKHREFPMASGEMSGPEFTAFLAQSFRLMAAHSAEASIHFACGDWRHLVDPT